MIKEGTSYPQVALVDRSNKRIFLNGGLLYCLLERNGKETLPREYMSA